MPEDFFALVPGGAPIKASIKAEAENGNRKAKNEVRQLPTLAIKPTAGIPTRPDR